MKKSLLWIVVLVLSMSMAVAFSLAGRKTTTAAETTAAETTAAETTAAETTAAETTAAETTATKTTFDKPVTITFLQGAIDPDTLDVIIGTFNKTYPNITVKYTYATMADILPILKSTFAAGVQSDISSFEPGAMLREYREFLEPLAPLCEAEWGKNWEDLIYDSCNKQIENAGKEYYAMPLGWAITGVFANVKLLKDNGLEIPKNLKDLENIRDTLKPKGLFTIFSGFVDNWQAADTFQFVMDEYCPGLFYEAEDGKASFDDPKFVDALKAWKNLFDSEIIQPGVYGIKVYMDAVVPFTEGKQGAMMILGSWHLAAAYLNQFKLEDYQVGGFLPIKFPDLNGDGKNPRPTLNLGSTLGISKNIKDPYEKAAAWEFVKYVVAGEGAAIFADGFNGYPSFKSVKMHDSAYDKAGAAIEELKANAQWYLDNPETQGARQPKYAELQQGLYDTIAAVATGQQTPEEAAKRLQEISAAIER